MTNHDEKDAQIISLDEFRQQITNPEIDDSLTAIISPEYLHNSLVYTSDYRSQFTVNRMLELLNPEENPKSTVVLSRFVIKRAARVIATSDTDSRYYAVDKNYGELEEIAADLENIPEVQARRLGFPLLERFYTTSLVAHKLITDGTRLNEKALNALPIPEVGPGNPFSTKCAERTLEIKKWQLASGLGLLAVSQEQPKQYARLRNYLNGILEHRFYYAQALRSFEETIGIKVFGLGPPDGDEISDRMIGIGNPAGKFQVRSVLNIPAAETDI